MGKYSHDPRQSLIAVVVNKRNVIFIPVTAALLIFSLLFSLIPLLKPESHDLNAHSPEKNASKSSWVREWSLLKEGVVGFSLNCVEIESWRLVVIEMISIYFVAQNTFFWNILSFIQVQLIIDDSTILC